MPRKGGPDSFIVPKPSPSFNYDWDIFIEDRFRQMVTALPNEASITLPVVVVREWLDEEGWNIADMVTIYATDEKMLLKFIDEEYTRRPDDIHQVITQYRPVKL